MSRLEPGDESRSRRGEAAATGARSQSREVRVVAPAVVPEGIPAPTATGHPAGSEQEVRVRWSEPADPPAVSGRHTRIPACGGHPRKSCAPPPTVAETIDGLIAEGIAALQRFGREGGAAARSHRLDGGEGRLQVGHRQASDQARTGVDSDRAPGIAAAQPSGQSDHHGS